MTYRYVFMIGTTMSGGSYPIINLEALPVPVIPPGSTFSPYANTVDLADGSKRGVGAPVATWHWGFLRQVQRDQLRTFCLDVTSQVYIRTYTKDNQSAPKYYRAKMHWPVVAEETFATRRLDFKIEFTQLVLQADP